MCCLFGMIDYGHSFTGKQKTKIIHALATSAEARGTDASGIAYNSGGKLHVYKRPLPGHKPPLHIPNDAAVVMGHTRLTTQGDGKRNYNNHPFQARAGKTAFALAHNGVLNNDRQLRRALQLPRTKIETDSFIAVQLLQQQRTLNFDSLRYMAEKVEGSFSFTVLDGQDNLYFVKGDSPLCIGHFPKQRIYLYASTPEILLEALRRIPYPLEEPEQVDIRSGELLMIARNGGQRRSAFRYSDPFVFGRFDPWHRDCQRGGQSELDSYTRALKSVAGTFGVSPDQIDRLLDEGFTHEEIEEYLYGGEVQQWTAF